jgi:hypothetical protein
MRIALRCFCHDDSVRWPRTWGWGFALVFSLTVWFLLLHFLLP